MNANAQPMVRRPVSVRAFKVFVDESGVVERVNFRRPPTSQQPAPRPR